MRNTLDVGFSTKKRTPSGETASPAREPGGSPVSSERIGVPSVLNAWILVVIGVVGGPELGAGREGVVDAKGKGLTGGA